MSGFRKAVKSAAKLRMALAGPAGSGKTYTALVLATALAKGGPVAVIDTERGSASKYADLFEFDVLELDNFHPQNYVNAINEAAQAGYAVVVIDSLSHAWNGKGGILEIVQRANTGIKAWAQVKPIENALIETITGARIHIIATMRTKTEYVVEQDERGKAAPRKVGTAPVQRDGMEYEFDVFGELDQENTLTIHKTRCPALTGAVMSKPGKALAETLRAWLDGGAPVAQEPQEPAAPTPIRTQSAPTPKPEPQQVGDGRAPTPKQVDAIKKLCDQLGEGLPEGLTYQTAGKMIFELNKRIREQSQPPAVEAQVVEETLTPDPTNDYDLRGLDTSAVKVS